MSKVISVLVIFIIFLIENGSFDDSELQEDISYQLERDNGKVLSRKRRYLVFPEGSSFQIVYCLTWPSVGLGALYVFGNTAALAWELPSTPLYYSIKDYEKKAEEEANAETTTIEIPHDIDLSSLSGYSDNDDLSSLSGYSDNDHHRISTDFLPWNSQFRNTYQKIDRGYPKWQTNSYNRQPVSITYNNPFLNFIKSSGFNTQKKASYGFDNNWGLETNDKSEKYYNYGKTDSGNVRGYSNGKNFERFDSQKSQFTRDMDPVHYSVHRRTRRDLYRKIENLFTAFKLDGQVCVLKAICEVTKSSEKKGNFIKEIIKAIFRIKLYDNHPNEDKYDNAANTTHNCDNMYPTCKGSIFSNLFLFQD